MRTKSTEPRRAAAGIARRDVLPRMCQFRAELRTAILGRMGDSNSRTVYSTGAGSRCPKCGWPVDNCRCSDRSGRDEPVPARVVAKLRIEKSGRGGKTVTVVYDLPRNQAFLRDVAGELKRACGTGGTVVDNTVELQGDVRERVRPLLAKKGWTVKG